jgi:hypothetical protein
VTAACGLDFSIALTEVSYKKRCRWEEGEKVEEEYGEEEGEAEGEEEEETKETKKNGIAR